MKNFLLVLTFISLTINVIAQGNGKIRSQNKKEKETKVKRQANNDIYSDNWNEPTNASKSKSSKNQPAKVRAGFQRDYPNAVNVVWSKYRGDWTATYNSVWGRSTAVYHANGERKDTRSSIKKNQLPAATPWDNIFKRDRIYVVGNVIQIESPGAKLFRIGSQIAGASLKYFFYNENGQQIKYDY
ncbi:MAG: hypothetical protein ABIN94_13510 [Ferruginibacter sp.]